MRNAFRPPAARFRPEPLCALLALALGLVTLASCRRDPGPPPPVGPPTASVSGIERIEWDQPPLEGTDPLSYRFVAYIDDVETELRDAACRARVRPATFRCTATLPTLSVGRHMIRLSAISSATGKALESPRSTVLVVEKH